MKKRMALGGSAAVLVAAAGFGGLALAGGGDEREAGARIVAEPITATQQGSVVRAGGSTITTLYSAGAVDPPEDAGTVTGLKCPRSAGKAISGGAATGPGIVISYLSQIRPTNGDISGRTYWIGVDDNSITNPANSSARLEVHCAKGIAVRK